MGPNGIRKCSVRDESELARLVDGRSAEGTAS